MNSVVILGTGHAVPPRATTNAELATFMDTSDEWIQQRSGIKERRWCREGMREFVGSGNADLAERAIRMALTSAHIDSQAVDALIYVTISPDSEIPGSALEVAERLGLRPNAPHFDVRNHCSGFLYGLLIARGLVESGRAQNVVVVGVEVQSSGLLLSDAGRGTAVLFGDGAGAVVVGPSAVAGTGIRQLLIESNGEYAERLGVACPSFARAVPVSEGDFAEATPAAFPHMDGSLVFKLASATMPELVNRVLAAEGLPAQELSLVVPHQANQRILDMLGRALGAPEKVFSNIAHYGNTTGASIPLALSEAVQAGRVARGDWICLVSFGAGFSWGAALIKW